MQRIFCPNLPEKLLCDKLSSYKFSVVLGTLYFSQLCCHKHETLILEIWFLITHLKKTYARLCKNIVGSHAAASVFLSSFFTVLRFAIHIPVAAIMQQGTSDLDWSRPKAASLSKGIYVTYVACIIIYITTILWASQHCFFDCTYMQHAKNSMAKCIHPNTAVKIKNNNFSVLAWHW